MMTCHKLTAGNGYEYLTRQVTRHDEHHERGQDMVDYYAGSGNPPGQWFGRGAAAMGVSGEVSEAQMERLYGTGEHPDTGEQLGRKFYLYKSLEERVEARLAAEPAATAERRAAIAGEEQAKPQREAVAGFDCVFSPVKSVSVLWGIGDDDTRTVIEGAHREAWQDTVAWIEDHVAYTRVGTNGIAYETVAGLTAAAFDHRSSRTGDPQLHTHVVLSTKVQSSSGRWLSLDGEALYKATVAASERYNSRVEALLRDRLGVEFAGPEDGQQTRVVREIVGIPAELITTFASRRQAVKARYSELLLAYRDRHGHEPPVGEQFKLAQQATLDTRPRKKDGTSAGNERDEWRDTARTVTGLAPEQLVRRVRGPVPSRARLDPAALETLAAEAVPAVIANVETARSTFTRRHIEAEAERVVRTLAVPLGQRDELVATVVTGALSAGRVIELTPPSLIPEPAGLRLPDGNPIWRLESSRQYTTGRILTAEDALVAAARTTTGPAVAPAGVEATVRRFAAEHNVTLDADQHHAVVQLATSGRPVELLVAPAGTGKTYTQRVLAAAWQEHGGRVIGLGPSARATSELAAGTEIRAETLAKWMHETTVTPPRQAARRARWDAEHPPRSDASARRRQDRRARQDDEHNQQWAMRPGDLFVIDEAGMADTLSLDLLRHQAEQVGAKVVLVGDHRQLGAVGAGGALRLLYHEVGAAELATLHRFTQPWEAAASVRLRDGDRSVIEIYLHYGRVRTGSTETLKDELYQQWRADERLGVRSLMMAASNETVAELSARARAGLVAAGTVEADGILLRDGTHAGVGDRVVTRRNDRELRVLDGRDWVKNGDLWTVTAGHPDGSLSVTHLHHGAQIRLPRRYVAEHVQLGYATTVHRAQGITVDSARLLIEQVVDRSLLYVGMTRGAHLNEVLCPTEVELDIDLDRPPPPAIQAWDRLAACLERSDGLSATETVRVEHDREASLPVLAARYEHVCDLAADHRLATLVDDALPDHDAQVVLTAPAWPALRAELRQLETEDVEPAEILAVVYQHRTLDGADDEAAVLHARIGWYLGENRAERTVRRALPEPDAARVLAAGSWSELHRQLDELTDHGHDTRQILETVARQAPLAGVDDVAAELHRRVDRWLDSNASPPLELTQPDRPRRYRGLSPAPEEPGDIGDYARTLHAHLLVELEVARHHQLAEPWAGRLLDDGIAVELVDDIATWRALHGITTDQPLGPDPTPLQPAPRHRTQLTIQLERAYDQTLQTQVVDVAELVATIDAGERIRAEAPSIHQGELDRARGARDAARALLIDAQTRLEHAQNAVDQLGRRARRPDRQRAEARLQEAQRQVELRTDALADRQGVLDIAEDRWHQRQTYLDRHATTLTAADRATDRLRHHAHDLADQYLEQPLKNRPGWLAELGPIPDDPDSRQHWKQLAADIIDWRARHHIDDPDRALGPRLTGRTRLNQDNLAARLLGYHQTRQPDRPPQHTEPVLPDREHRQGPRR